MDARPRRHDNSEYHPLVEEMEREAESVAWVREAAVRLREEGHVFTGEVLVVSEDDGVTSEQLDEVAARLLGLDWKVHDLSVVPVAEVTIPDPTDVPD